jgi:hypothetical protein
MVKGTRKIYKQDENEEEEKVKLLIFPEFSN